MVSDDERETAPSVSGNARLIVSLTAVAGLALTLLFNVAPAIEPAYQNRSLHVAKETAAAIVLLLVAALLFGRFRQTGRLRELLALAGVVVLAGKNLVFSVLTAILIEASDGLTTWRMTGAGMLAASLLAASAVAPARVVRARSRDRALLLTGGACLLALGILMAIAAIFELPAAFTQPPETRTALESLSEHPALLVTDISATVLFLVAGAFFAHRAEREGDEFQLWLGVGATIAGMAYLNYSLLGSAYTDFLYAGDLFRIAAVAAWGISAIRVISEYQRTHAETVRLEERRRVARHLHDGVAQELAFMSTQMQRLAREVGQGPAASQITESLQRALDESRGAISALSRPAYEPLHLALAHAAEEVADRLGARLKLDLEEGVSVPAAWEEALPQILREALASAVSQGEARRVTIHFRDQDGIWLRISDDGEGFDLSQLRSETSFGLTGVKERTESLGGEFRLSSSPGRGTSVEILLP